MTDSGPQTCLGKSLAEVQIALSIARLFHRLDLELETEHNVLKTKTAPTPGPSMDFKVRVRGISQLARVSHQAPENPVTTPTQATFIKRCAHNRLSQRTRSSCFSTEVHRH